ncbi:GSCOCG00013479001-RA-CDS, partial [Cotesia congregata]
TAADSTLKNYNGTLKLWWNWNDESDGNLYEVSGEKILKFLTKRFGDGVDHSTINSARAALSLISSEDVSNNPLISRFVKGASKIRPGGRGPKYESTWDVDPVLAKLESWAPVEELSPKKLTEKLVVLLALGTAHRCQTLALIKISNIITSETLNQYVTVTKDLRGSNDSLFISLNKPYGAVKSETIARWIRSALESLGVDKRFTAHSTRHASTSRAHEKGVSIDEIKKVAGWSKNSKVFADFYHQPINIRDKNFAEAVLTPST